MVIFFDIDGVIIDDDTQIIPESTIRAIEALGRNGHLAVVNTGRPYAHIDPRVRAMPFGGFVCGCGMELRLGDTWLSRKYPDLPLRRYVLEAIRDCGMQTILEPASTDFLLDGENSVHPMIRRDVERMRARGFGIWDIRERETLEFVKGITFDWPGCDREGFLKRMEPYFNCFLRDNTLIEFVPKGCSKAAGMLEFLDHLGISPEDTMAIGDSTNDLPMFSVAKHKVCMGNGMDELKARATYITADLNEDGVEKALHHFGLI